MTERKSSINQSTNSKVGAGDFGKKVQRKFSRAQEKVLQRFGKAEETRDEEFDTCVRNFQDQQNDGHRIYKDLKAYINAAKVMRDASSRLYQSLFDAYEQEWDGIEDIGAVVEGEDLLWNDFESKLRDQALLTMESYMSQFPDIRERIAKRSRKMVDYDSSRHHLETLKQAKKKEDIKIDKAENEMKIAKKIFEDMNMELKEELPVLHDSRIGCYVTVFQAISNLKENFYKEMDQNNQSLQNIMADLKSQYPDKNFVIRNINGGTLKRRSLKDALSPKSLRASFSDFHMSYSPRGSLRREQSASFRSDRVVYSPEFHTSPVKPKPVRNSNNRVTDTGPSSRETIKVEETSTDISDDTKLHGDDLTAKKMEDKIEESQEIDIKNEEQVLSSEQDEKRKVLDPKCDLSQNGDDENGVDVNVNYCEKANPQTSSHIKAEEACTEEHKESGSCEMENGISTHNMTDLAGTETSDKETTKNNDLDELKTA